METQIAMYLFVGDPNSLEIMALEVRAAPAGRALLLLVAIVNVARSPEIRYAIGNLLKT